MSKKTKLHEILAVEGDLEGTFKEIVKESIDTFTKRADHFLGHHKTLEMKDEERKFEEPAAEEHKEVVTTVDEKLNYASGFATRYFDVFLQKEDANQRAKADLVVDGETLAVDLPATFLLGMENRLKILKRMYEAVPTLSPGTRWETDPAERKGVYRAANPEVKAKTEKIIKYKVIFQPDEHHPGKYESFADNVVVGVFKTERWSGMLTPAKKSEYLERIDKLIRAVKKARQQANTEEVGHRYIGQSLLDYIHRK